MSTLDKDILWLGIEISGGEVVQVCAIVTDQDLEAVGTFYCSDVGEMDENLERFMTSHGLYTDVVIAGKNLPTMVNTLRECFPLVSSRLGDRHIDINTLAELMDRWRGNLYRNRPTIVTTDSLLGTIENNVDELRYYKEVLLRS